MDASHDLTRRLTELEVKASFADDAIDQLNHALYRQQQLIDRLVHEIATLKQNLPEPGDQPFTSLRDELPPHY